MTIGRDGSRLIAPKIAYAEQALVGHIQIQFQMCLN